MIQRSDVFGKIRLTISRLDRRRKLDNQSDSDRRKLILLRVAIHFVVFLILGGIAYAIYHITVIDSPQLLSDLECVKNPVEIDYSNLSTAYFQCLLSEYLPSIFVTFSNLAVPFIFTKLINYEKYEANNKLMLNLFRCILLRLASILVTMVSLQSKVDCNYACIDSNDESVDNCVMNNSTLFQSCTNENWTDEDLCSKPICWESYVGEQLYKLTFVDFLVQIGIVFLYDTPRTYLFGKCLENSSSFQGLRNMLGIIHFDMTKHVLDIVYSMTICWMGLYFAPLISLVTLLKFAVIFYLRLYFVNYVRHKLT